MNGKIMSYKKQKKNRKLIIYPYKTKNKFTIVPVYNDMDEN